MNTDETKSPANYVHLQISDNQFDAVSKGWRFKRFHGKYDRVEYLNSPSGLIVLAHQNTIEGQVDGIHPANLASTIEDPRNIVETLAAKGRKPFIHAPIPYNAHWITRKSQGNLVLGAFGRMVDAGDPEAHCIETPEGEAMGMAVYDAPFGPVVGVFDSFTNDVFVILDAGNVDFLENGATPGTIVRTEFPGNDARR